MKVVSVDWNSNAFDSGVIKSRSQVVQNMPPVVYGMAIHPMSEIRSIVIVGSDRPVIVEGAPMVWPRGIKGGDVREWERMTPCTGRAVIAIAESPDEVHALPRNIADSITRSASIQMPTTQAASSVRQLTCDVNGRMQGFKLWIPSVPTWTGDVVLSMWVAALYPMPRGALLSNTEEATSIAPGFGFRTIQTQTVPQGVEFNMIDSLQFAGACALLFQLNPGAGTVSDATQRALNMYLTVFRS